MSLTPGFILAEDRTSIGLTLTEIAAIVAEWDAAYALILDDRRDRKAFSVEGMPTPLRIGWDFYAQEPVLSVHRGCSGGNYADVEAPQIAEMRAALEAAR